MDYTQFNEALKQNEELREQLKAYMAEKKPTNQEEEYAAIIDFAASKGYTFTVEDVSAVEAGNRELDEEELDKVYGGGKKHPERCAWTFEEGENCWVIDQCNHVAAFTYDNCRYSYNGDEDCSLDDRCSYSSYHYNG